MQRRLRTSYAAAFLTDPVWVDYELLSGALVKVLIALRSIVKLDHCHVTRFRDLHFIGDGKAVSIVSQIVFFYRE